MTRLWIRTLTVRLLLVGAFLAVRAAEVRGEEPPPVSSPSPSPEAAPAPPIRDRFPPPDAPQAPRCATDTRGEVLQTVVRVVPSATAVLPAEFDGNHGDVSIFRGAIDVEGRRQLSATTSFLYALGYERSSYDFSDPDSLVPGAGRLLESTEIWRLAPGFLWRLPNGWGAAATFDVRSSRAIGAGLDGSFTYGVTGGVRIPLGKIAISVGGSWESSLEGGGFFAPILAFSDNSTSGALRVNARGSGLIFAYDLNDRWAVGLSVRYEPREYRLAKGDRIPEGIVADLRVPVGLDVEWKPSPHVSVTLSGGASAYTEFRFEDKNGDKLRYLEADPSPTFSLYVTLKF